MCKPGASCGCHATSAAGIGLAAAAVMAVGTISTAATVITDVLTVALVTALTVAAAGTAYLVLIVRRNRGLVLLTRTGRPAPRTVPARVVPAITEPERKAIEAPRQAAAGQPAREHAEALR